MSLEALYVHYPVSDYYESGSHDWLLLQPPPVYADLAPQFYEELEARVEDAVRDALYGRLMQPTHPSCMMLSCRIE
jgi:hypothetical protein